MKIVNNDGSARSWFAYNYEDTAQWIALASDPIDAGSSEDWGPPKNGSGYYTVLIKRDKTGGSIMAAGSGNMNATFTFDGYKLIVS